MKITQIETIPVEVPLKEGLTTKTAGGEHVVSPYVIVQIHTDEGLVGLGESPGCWAPEPYAPLPSAAEEEERQPRDDRGCCERAAATASDFVSAFRYPPFRWLFVCNVFNQCCETRKLSRFARVANLTSIRITDGQISNLFFIYW